MTRYARDIKWKFLGDVPLAMRYIPQARVVVGQVLDVLGTVPTKTLTRRITRNVSVRVDGWGSQLVVTIRARGESPAQQETPVNAIWIPKGFVVYPANNDAPQGWGLPVLQVSDVGVTPYDDVNTAPGLDVDRWTPGGALGQVLLSKIPGAGYPEARPGNKIVPAPLFFHHEYGPKVDKYTEQPPQGWKAYRIELDGYANDPVKHECFERTNDLRTAVSRDPLCLPPKFFFNSAQASAEIAAGAHVLGHFSKDFTPTWKRPVDRVMRDGIASASLEVMPDGGNVNYWEIAVTKGFTTQTGVDPNGVGIFDVTGDSQLISAEDAVDAWRNSIPHYLAIINTDLNLKLGPGTIGATQIGFEQSYATQHLNRLNQWIGCGNRSWKSRHPEIPIVSWFGYPTLNLGFETMPGEVIHGVLANPPPDPPDPLFSTMYSYGLDIADPNTGDIIGAIPLVNTLYNGEYWPIEQQYQTDPASSDARGVVYMRGRALAKVPMNGLVWAAAIQKKDNGSGLPPTYVLVVLTHHNADQPNSVSQQGLLKTNGSTAKLRVWWNEMSVDGVFSANPERLIYGVYGDEDEGWDWDEKNSPFSWRGGVIVDVGTSDGSTRNLLKYASQWVFNSEGTEAICMRDYGTFSDFGRLRPAPGTASVDIIGLNPVAVEMDLHDLDAPSVSARALPACDARVQGECGDDLEPLTYFDGHIVAAGYDAEDEPKFAFVFSVTFTPYAYIPETQTNYQLFGFNTDYDWMPACTLHSPALTIFHSATRQEPASPLYEQTNYFAHHPMVLDVADEVVVVESRPPKMQEKLFDVQDGHNLYSSEPNPDAFQCLVNWTGIFVQVRAWRAGELLGTRTYDHPDHSLPNNDFTLLTYRKDSFTNYAGVIILNKHICRDVVPSYAKHGDDWILSYTVTPQPYVAHVDMDMDLTPIGVDPAMESCSPSVMRVLGGLDYVTHVRRGCRGGYAYSSFASNDDLMDMTQTVGVSPRFIYARAV